MRRSRPPSRREVARFAKSRASQMRNISTGRPDSIPVIVTSQLMDGRCICKRDNWPHSIIARVVPASAKIPTPRRLDLFFEEGDKQRPFLFWPYSEPGLNGPGVVEEIVAELTRNWICWGADFARSFSWLDSAFDLSTMEQRAGYIAISGEFARIETDVPGQVHPGPTIVFYGDRAQALSGYLGTPTEYWAYYSRILEHLNLLAEGGGGEVYFQSVILEAVRLGGYLYMAVQADYYENPDEEEGFSHALWTLKYSQGLSEAIEPYPGSEPSLDPGDKQDKPWTLIWGAKIDSREDNFEDAKFTISPTKLGVRDGDTEPSTHARVVVSVGAYENPGSIVYSLDARDGGAVRTLEVGPSSSIVYSIGNKVWINDVWGGTICHLEINTEGEPILVWDSGDWTLREEDGELHLRILGFAGGNIVCEFDGEIVYETVTSNLFSNDRFSFGNPYTQDYKTRAAGWSSKAGSMALDANTGAILGRSYHPGDPVADGFQTINHQQLVERGSQTFEGPTERPKTLTPGPPRGEIEFPTAYGGYIPCVWGVVPRLYGWFQDKNTEPHFINYASLDVDLFEATIRDGIVYKAPEQYNWYPYAGGIVDIDAAIAWNDDNQANLAAHRNAQTAEWQAILNERDQVGGPGGAVEYDYLQIEAPAWGKASAGADPTYLGMKTWTSVKPRIDTSWIGYGGGPDTISLSKYGSPYGLAGSAAPKYFGNTTPEAWAGANKDTLWDEVVLDPGKRSIHDPDLESLIFAAPLGGVEYKSTQKFLFRTVEQNEQFRSPPSKSGYKTCSTGAVVVRGPNPVAVYDPDADQYNAEDYTWTGYLPSGAIAWQYTLSGSGALDCNPSYGGAGTPVAIRLADEETVVVATLVSYGKATVVWKRVILNAATGELLEIENSPPNMLEVIVDKTHLVSEDSQVRIGPPL